MAYQIVDNTSHAVTLNRYNLPLLVCGVLSDIKSLHVTNEYSYNCQHTNWRNKWWVNMYCSFKITHLVNLLLHQFNQPKVQWLKGNIGYGSVQALHSRLELWIRKARVLDFCLPTIRSFQRKFFEDYFFTVLDDFGVPLSINFLSSSAFLGFPEALEQNAISFLVSFVRRLEHF